jgi:hypothetical protein
VSLREQSEVNWGRRIAGHMGVVSCTLRKTYMCLVAHMGPRVVSVERRTRWKVRYVDGSNVHTVTRLRHRQVLSHRRYSPMPGSAILSFHKIMLPPNSRPLVMTL